MGSDDTEQPSHAVDIISMDMLYRYLIGYITNSI